MRIYKLNIVTCRSDAFWYSRYIGCDVFATKYDDGHAVDFVYKLVNVGHFEKSGSCYFDAGDVRILEEFDGEVVEKMTTEIVIHPEKVQSLAWRNVWIGEIKYRVPGVVPDSKHPNDWQRFPCADYVGLVEKS